MQLVDPQLSTRRWLKLGLAVGGAVAGAAFGIVLTRLGKIVAGAPPATLANYAWNAAVFGVLAGIVSPVVSWSVLRRVPLWRTVIEPLTFAVAGGVAAVIFAAPVLLFVLPPAGLVLGFVRLQRRYPDPHALSSTLPVNER
jgi:predicted transporter